MPKSDDLRIARELKTKAVRLNQALFIFSPHPSGRVFYRNQSAIETLIGSHFAIILGIVNNLKMHTHSDRINSNLIESNKKTQPYRIVCLVPSITETLIECKVNLVGRSRFCIHPEVAVSKIKKVGGTKDIDWQKVVELNADLVILDKEENTLEMAQSCPVEYIALHIQSVHDVAPELEKLSVAIKNTELKRIADRWKNLLTNNPPACSFSELPGVLEWWQKPQNAKQLIYLIWKNPWMAAGEGIFIQSVLAFLGLEHRRVKFDQKYPSIDLQDYSSEDTLLLFSSEPFPFQNCKQELLELGFPCALVDGELFSWYGIRSLQFLEALIAERN